MNEQDIILIIKYLEGALSQEEQQLFDEKMVQDAEFRTEVTNQTQTTSQLKELLTSRKKQLHQSLQKVVQIEKKNRKRKRLWGLILSVLLLGLVSWWTITKFASDTRQRPLPKNDSVNIVQPNAAPKVTSKDNNSVTLPKAATNKGKAGAATTIKPKPAFYVAYIPEYVFYSGSAFVGTAPNEEKRRAIKIYTQLPTQSLNPHKAYYQFTDTLSVYGKAEQDITGLVHEQSLSRFGLVVGKDSIQLQINDVKWRLLEK